MGAKHDANTRAKISAALTGRTLSDETKKKMSESHLQNPHPFTGKVSLHAKKISLYSIDNTLIQEFSSHLVAARALGSTTTTLRRYKNQIMLFRGKYFIRG